MKVKFLTLQLAFLCASTSISAASTAPLAEIVEPSEQISDEQARLELVKALIYSKDPTKLLEAQQQVDALLKGKPNDPQILFLYGLIFLSEKKYQEAEKTFDKIIALNPSDPELLIQLGVAETTLGYAKKARQLFEKALKKQPVKSDHLLTYAGSMLMWGDFYQSEKIFRGYLNKNKSDIDTALKLANVLLSEQRYEEAEAIYEHLIHKGACLKGMLALARLKLVQKDFEQALEIASDLAIDHPENAAVLMVKAEALGLLKDYKKASQLYQKAALLGDPEQKINALILAGKNLDKLGETEEATRLYETAHGLDPGNVQVYYYLSRDASQCGYFLHQMHSPSISPQQLNILGELYAEDDLTDVALDFFLAAIEKNPDYFPAQMNAAAMFSIALQYEDALEIYNRLLADFPCDYKILLERARIVSGSKQFKAGVALYDELIALKLNNPLPLREKARVQMWDQKGRASMETYQDLYDVEVNDLFDEASNAYAMYLIQQGACLESNAKWQLWYKRPMHAIYAYEDLLAFAPGNEEGVFDYAQAYCNIGLCKRSTEVYDYLLDIDHLHTYAKMALDREALRYCPQFDLKYSFWWENGRGGLSSMQRHRWNAGVVTPLTCNIQLRGGAERWLEMPFYPVHRTFIANGATIGINGIINACWAGSATVSQKVYLDRSLGTKYVSNEQLAYNWYDYATFTIGHTRQDILQNYFAVIQGTQADLYWGILNTNLTRALNCTATYQYWDYNDNNDMHFALLQTSLQLLEFPTLTKFTLEAEYRNTRYLDLFIYNGPTLVDIIHPYWTPQKYWAGRLSLQTRFDYAPFQFCGAEQRYLDLKIWIGTDTEKNNAWAWTFQWHHEFCDVWTFEVDGFMERSLQWNAYGLWANLNYKF